MPFSVSLWNSVSTLTCLAFHVCFFSWHCLSSCLDTSTCCPGFFHHFSLLDTVKTYRSCKVVINSHPLKLLWLNQHGWITLNVSNDHISLFHAYVAHLNKSCSWVEKRNVMTENHNIRVRQENQRNGVPISSLFLLIFLVMHIVRLLLLFRSSCRLQDKAIITMKQSVE